MTEHLILDGRVIICDDVLRQDEFDSVLQLLERVQFNPIDPRSAPIWRSNLPLNPTIGERIIWLDRHDQLQPPPAFFSGSAVPSVGQLFSQAGYRVYPTHSAFDRIVETAVDVARRHGLVAHVPGLDSYAGCLATLYCYGAGTRLAWHNDKDYLGAFSAYLSTGWSENGGGCLAVQWGADQKTMGVGQMIEPRRNRLVVFAPGVRHSILSVAEDVAFPRVSLSGFFLSRSQMGTVITMRLGEYIRGRDRAALDSGGRGA